MNVRTIGAMLALLAVTATGCGGSEEPAAADEDSPTASASESSAAPEPNVGDNALRLGETREGKSINTTVLAYTSLSEIKPPDFLSGESDADGALLQVKECVAASDPEAPYTLGRYDFELRDSNEGAYTPASSTWDEWPPRPQMPAEKDVAAGACITGWVLMSVPNDVRITKAALVAEGTTIAEWVLE